MHWLKGKPDTFKELVVWVEDEGIVIDVEYNEVHGFIQHTGQFTYKNLSNVTAYMYVSKPS